jgi:1-acyl-sn-glycerol-3-phosphate acyltransferase
MAGHLMALIRSVLFKLLFFLGTAIHCFGVLAVSPIGSGPVQAIVHSWSRMHYWLLRHVMAIRFEWDGQLPAGAYLIAVKHESMVEAVDTLRFADTPVVVLKRELAPMVRRSSVVGRQSCFDPRPTSNERRTQYWSS